jgi:hypothetical protein
MANFSPWGLGMTAGGTAAICADGPVRAMPGNGCAFWEREVGADDEDGPPAGAAVPLLPRAP